VKPKDAPEPTVAGHIPSMLDARLYGRGVERVRLIQTHTSWVFLTGTHAYKVKKPVNFGFLDYTTLSARRFFCTEEFRLNRSIAPDIYIGVVPITLGRGGLRIGGRGRIIDYALKMRELPQDWLMTEQLRRDRVTYGHIDEIARLTAEFHARAERGPQVAQYGSSEIIKLNWDENFAQTMDFRGRTIAHKAYDELRRSVERFVMANRGRFRYRREAGFVRRCHGDLHSKNIFVDDGVHIFDCIEFNPRFSCSDVASEVAFFVMDLEYAGRHDLAGYFVERYLAYTRDTGMLRLLDFYKCYRAYVRGKVTSFNLNDAGISAGDKARARKTARSYFELSLTYARRLESKPWLAVMMGLPGTGKTFIARRLAARTGAFHLLSDSIRKQLLGIPVTERRWEGYNKGIYRGNIGKKTYDEMFRRAGVFLGAGQSVILDATFLHPESRERARETARRAGVGVRFLLAECPEPTVRRRLVRREIEHSFSDANVEVYLAMKRRFAPPRSERDVMRINTRQPAAQLVKRIERALLHL
jgi:hypothetical protein